MGGGARTGDERGGACLTAAPRRRVETRRFISLRGKVMRRWWSSFWRQGRRRRQRNSRCWVCGAGFDGFLGLCCVGFAGLRVFGARGYIGRRVGSNGGSMRLGCVPEFEICPTCFQGKTSVSDQCHILFSPSEHLDLVVGESIPRRIIQISEVQAEIGETRCRMRLHVYTGWNCGGVAQRGP